MGRQSRKKRRRIPGGVDTVEAAYITHASIANIGRLYAVANKVLQDETATESDRRNAEVFIDLIEVIDRDANRGQRYPLDLGRFGALVSLANGMLQTGKLREYNLKSLQSEQRKAGYN